MSVAHMALAVMQGWRPVRTVTLTLIFDRHFQTTWRQCPKCWTHIVRGVIDLSIVVVDWVGHSEYGLGSG